MKKILLLAALCIYSTLTWAQKSVQIGVTEIVIQSPVKVISHPEKSKRDRMNHTSEMYMGFGLAVNDAREDYMPLFYGSSYDIQIGVRDIYRNSGNTMAIGSFACLSMYSYKLDRAYFYNPLVADVPGDVSKEYYRSSNITAGIFARLYLNRAIYMDLGPYGEYGYSRRYKIKTTIAGQDDIDKVKYRDGRRFNPVNAGLQCSLGFSKMSVYAKYRLTNYFNPDKIEKELPRLHVGVMFDLD
jgi:hypothetical protein